LKENYQDLCDLVKAVEKGQADHARRLARDHVHRFNRYMQSKKQRTENRGQRTEDR
jgi:DNA-binding FadR family transcriptional regulator